MQAFRSRRWQTITLAGLGLQTTQSIYYHPEKGASHAEVFLVYCDRRYFPRWMCGYARFTVAWKQRTRQITQILRSKVRQPLSVNPQTRNRVPANTSIRTPPINQRRRVNFPSGNGLSAAWVHRIVTRHPEGLKYLALRTSKVGERTVIQNVFDGIIDRSRMTGMEQVRNCKRGSPSVSLCTMNVNGSVKICNDFNAPA